jgi:methylglutaconyl-CoA hydratase
VSSEEGLKTYATITVTDNGSIRTVTLNRPERRNAMTPEMQLELLAAFEDAASGDCRVLVLAGAGDAFCSGLDLSELQSTETKSPLEHRADSERLARLFLALYELPIPTIAAVHGPAIAGGTGLAMICDFTIATPEAKFGFTEVRIGFVPALVSAFLALEAGHKPCMDLLLTGRLFGVDEALRLGLINEIVPPDRLAGRINELADTLLKNSPEALTATKRLLVAQNKEWLSTAIAGAIEASAEARTTSDFREGIAAFLEKRKPVWSK